MKFIIKGHIANFNTRYDSFLSSACVEWKLSGLLRQVCAGSYRMDRI